MSGCVRKHLCYCADCGKELAKRLRGRGFRDCVVNKAGPKKISPVEKTTTKCYVCGADDPTCSVLHGSTYDHTNADSLSNTLVFREHTCYCQVCACKEYAKVLAEKHKLTCPVCQREADRIIFKDAVDDERVPTLRRIKSAVSFREKLEEEILVMHRGVVPVERDSSSQAVVEDERNAQRELAQCRLNETMAAIRKLQEGSVVVQKSEVSSQQEPPNQRVAETRQNMQRSLTLRRYGEALSAFKKLVDAILDHCGAEVQLEQETPSETDEEGKQNLQTYSVMGLCEEAMSALEKIAEELLGNCDAEVPGHRESTSQTVADGRQNTKRGGLTEHTYKKTNSAFLKLYEAVWAVETPVQQQTPSDQTVLEDASTLRQVPLPHRCESAMFSWDKQCPFCQTTPDTNQISKCVSVYLTNCVALQYCCRKHLCHCIESNKKIVRMPRGRETRLCPFPFCRKPVDRVIMNAAPWKPRTVEEEINECLSCKAKEASKAEERAQKTKGSTSTTKVVPCKSGDNTQKSEGSTSKSGDNTQKSEGSTSKSGDNTQKSEGSTSKSGDNTQKTEGSTSKMKGEASTSAADRTQKTKSSTAKAKGETTNATDRAQNTKSSAPEAKDGVSKKPGDRTKSKDASSKATDPDPKATIPTCSVIHGNT